MGSESRVRIDVFTKGRDRDVIGIETKKFGRNRNGIGISSRSWVFNVLLGFFLWYFNLIPHGGGKKKASLLLIETWLAQKFGVQ